MNIISGNLWKLFNSLTDDEIKELDKAVHSPFFNYRDEEIRLFEYLHKIRKGRLRVPSGETACKYVFMDGKGDQAKLRHVMTYLARIIARYRRLSWRCGSGHDDEAIVRQSRWRMMRVNNT